MSDTGYAPTDYPPFAVTADVVVITVRDGKAMVLAHKRDQDPHAGRLALPGTFVAPDEDAETTALRALTVKAGIALGVGHLEQLATYSAPGRDPRMRVVSVAHVALVPDPGDPPMGEWTDPTTDGWAFDHATIVADGMERARAKIEYTGLAASLAGETFTLTDLSDVYEALWGHAPGYSAFRRKVLAADGFVEETGDTRPANKDGSGRPTKLYRAGKGTTLHPPITRDTT